MFYTLRALASSDVILLTCAMLQQVIPMFCLTTEQTNSFCLNQGYVKSVQLACSVHSTDDLYLVHRVDNGERYVAICHPLRAVSMCTVTKVRTAIITISVVAILFNIPKFFEFRPVESVLPFQPNITYVDLEGTSLRQDQVYRYLYNTALYCLIIFALPLSILTVLNFKIVLEMRRAKKQWLMLNRNRQRELQATILPLCIVCVFFICGMQSLIAFILDAIFVRHRNWLQDYTAIVNVLVIFNSAVNFLLMYLFGRKFRNLLMDLILCRNKSWNSPILTEATHV